MGRDKNKKDRRQHSSLRWSWPRWSSSRLRHAFVVVWSAPAPAQVATSRVVLADQGKISGALSSCLRLSSLRLRFISAAPRLGAVLLLEGFVLDSSSAGGSLGEFRRVPAGGSLGELRLHFVVWEKVQGAFHLCFVVISAVCHLVGLSPCASVVSSSVPCVRREF